MVMLIRQDNFFYIAHLGSKTIQCSVHEKKRKRYIGMAYREHKKMKKNKYK